MCVCELSDALELFVIVKLCLLSDHSCCEGYGLLLCFASMSVLYSFVLFSISVLKKTRKKNIAVSINDNNNKSGVLECTFSNDP